jgi:hypothetical protein
MTNLAHDFLRRATKKIRKKGRPKKGELPPVVNLDGKTLCGAIARSAKKSMIHIVNAVCNLVTLSGLKVREKSNEITPFL